MTHLTITGMTCGSCAAHVKKALEDVPAYSRHLSPTPKALPNLSPCRAHCPML